MRTTMASLDAYGAELAEAGLLATIARAEAEFQEEVTGATSRGQAYGFGGMRGEACRRLYALVRDVAPVVCLETGVCNGVSTAMILAALDRNDAGMLHSIDYPEYAGVSYPDGAFWPGKGGAVVPRGKEPGWLIPDPLRRRWTLTTGRSQDVLEPLLDRLGTIDFFLHDSEHSEACMRFEYERAWAHLRPGGVLVSDDVTWNTVFDDFARRVRRQPVPLAHNLALIIR